MKYLLEHDKANCIGCGACVALVPAFWKLDRNGKVDIIKGKERKDGWQELLIDENGFKTNREAAESCPVNVIHLTDLASKKLVI